MDDPSGNCFLFAAPGEFLGDKSALLGGLLTYDIADSYSQYHGVTDYAAILVGNGGYLTYQALSPGPSWSQFALPLSPQGWVLNKWVGGGEPTVAQMRGILESLSALYILGDWVSGQDHSTLDNVRLRKARVSGAAALEAYIGAIDAPLEVEVWQAGKLVESIESVYDADRYYAFSPTIDGEAVLRFRFKTSLWRAFAVTLSEARIEGLNVELLNGDVDGDNMVTVFDYNVLSAAFDSVAGDANWHPDADLDGYGAVTVFDYNLLSQNFDMVGD